METRIILYRTSPILSHVRKNFGIYDGALSSSIIDWHIPIHRRADTTRLYRVFADSLKSEEDKKLFLEMLEKCQKYSLAINAKGKPFPTEPLIMALLLEQHKMINWLENKIKFLDRDSSSVQMEVK